MNTRLYKFYPQDILYITHDPVSFHTQFHSSFPPRLRIHNLFDSISTDHIIRVNHLITDSVYNFGTYAFCGMPGEFSITPGFIRNLKKKIIVAGPSFGVGSSREQAVWALIEAGIQLVIAPSFGPIFSKNSLYIPLLTSTNFSIISQIHAGKPVPIHQILRGKTRSQKMIVSFGGLHTYISNHTTKIKKSNNVGQRTKIAQNIWEKRLSRTELTVYNKNLTCINIDLGYSYEAMSGLIHHALARNKKPIRNTLKHLYFFEDHFAHSSNPNVKKILHIQRVLAHTLRVPKSHYFKGKVKEGGGVGICHRVMLDTINPTQHAVIVGTDSHTPTLGVLPILAIPVGATLFASAIIHKQIPIESMKVTRVELTGKLPKFLSIRDVQLELAKDIKNRPVSPIIEFGGPGLLSLSFDEVTALCNMVPEVFHAEIAVTESFPAGRKYLYDHFRIKNNEADRLYGYADTCASYFHTIQVNLSKTSPWISKPDSPTNASSLATLPTNPTISKAFLVSCTLGIQDFLGAAAVLRDHYVAKNTQLIVVFGSRNIRSTLTQLGILTILTRSGAIISDESACGPCIGEGLGALKRNEIAITASNRNFPGRMGHINAKVYMGSSILTSLAALYGRIPTFDEYMEHKNRIEKNLRDF